MNKIKEQMRQYTGTKTIKAAPMTRGEYNKLRGWSVPENENPKDKGYIVEYMGTGNPNVEGFDNYISWSPAKTFKSAYKVSDTYVDRMEIELDELTQKISKINKFLESDVRDEYERVWLKGQLQAMKTYEVMLSARLHYVKEKQTK